MIPFCKTDLGEEEKRAVAEVIDSGWVVIGKKSEEFEEMFAQYVGAKHAVFVDSGTSALFLALQFIKQKYEYIDTIIVPSLTFTATAEAVVNAGFKVKFADVSKKNMCLQDYACYKNETYIPVHLVGNKAGAK